MIIITQGVYIKKDNINAMSKKTDIYKIGECLGLDKKDINKVLSAKHKGSDSPCVDTYKAGTKYGTVSPKECYKAGTRYGTVSPKEMYKAGTRYGTVSPKELYKAGTRYGTISPYDLI